MTFDPIVQLIAAGRLHDARVALEHNRGELKRIDAGLHSILLAQLTLEAGELGDASRRAAELISKSNRPELLALSSCIAAEVAAACCDFEQSDSHFAEAKRYCEKDVPAEIRSQVALTYWNCFSGVIPIEHASAEFSQTKRVVYSSGNPRFLIQLRLVAARLEARKGNVVEAERHWRIAQRALHRSPNVQLEAELLLDGCLLAFLRNDLISALEHARRAAIVSKESGRFRSEIGASINISHVLCAMGDTTGARKELQGIVGRLSEHIRLRVAALDCAATIAMVDGNLEEAQILFREIATLIPDPDSHLSQHWDVLSLTASRAELARRSGDYVEWKTLLAKGVQIAERTRDQVWLARMKSSLAVSLLSENDLETVSNIVLELAQARSKVPETIAWISRLSAAVNASQGVPVGNSFGRAERIANALGDHVLQGLIRDVVPTIESSTENPTLDDAAALVEVAGYPHVLAREAFTLLDAAAAATRSALIARGAGGVRVIDTANWPAAEAAAAAEEPGTYLHIVCGTHRDASWEIVAELKPALADRCRAVALKRLVDTAVTLDQYRRDEKQRSALWPADTFETDGGLFVSEPMVELLTNARRVAPSDMTVLLTGETGTGKEVIARAIHRASKRADRPFVPFNCSAVARDMLESQLFGYRKGAFTGADTAFDGVIRGAAGGTLFLDEVGEIGPELQPKLLRFLESREVHGLGEPHPVTVDVRVIAATNADLDTFVADGRFREDLFYRLNMIRLQLPPLRERREEIPALIDHYLRKAAEEFGKGRLTLDDETLEYLVLYAWPGNVRQLVNEIRRVAAFAEPDSVVSPALLSHEIQASRRTVRVSDGDVPEVRIRLDQRMNDAVEAIEQAMVRRALDRAHGNFENAARLLGISRKGLFLKRRRWGMQRAS